MKNWKSLPKLEEELIKYLEEMFPPLEYNVDEDIEEFKNRVIFRSGQRDLIKRLELLRKQQERR
tara:strand:+ start:701 stop:892 length:192 start_codon:yes stop_codon:yes gene_type:complete